MVFQTRGSARRRRLFATSLALLALGVVTTINGASNPSDNSADIAVIDRALASEKPGDPWINFGDVGMTRQQLQTFRSRLVAEQEKSRGGEPEVTTPPNTTFKWPSGNVFFRFDPAQVGDGTINAAKMQIVRDGMAEWAAFANLTFHEITDVTGVAHYITYQEDPTLGGGFSSSVGVAPSAEQFVKVGTFAWNRGTVCHETGHALGLFHEQQRDDRDTYVTINFDNIDSGNQPNFTKVPGGSTAIGEYDFYSVMHYARAALTNKTGTPNPNAPDPTIDTIDPTPPYVSFLNIMGNVYDRTLSKLDRAGMAAIYGNPLTLPSALVTNTKDGGPGSLRTAIYYAFDKSTDAVPVPTTITFHIPTTDSGYNSTTGVFTIKPTFLLTALGDGTTIDGTSQTGFGDTNPNGPEIALDGSSITALQAAPFFLFSPGLSLRSANCTIKGLTITNFNQEGIRIAQGATGNVIGGTTAPERNVISGNTAHGIYIHDSTTTNNLIQGNYIGTDQTGAAAQGNSFAGIAIDKGAHGNTIGGLIAGARNVISGNLNQGMLVGDAGSNANLVRGNYIGLNASGTAAIPNAFSGIDIFGGAQSNTIGGTAAGARNVISGNNGAGIAITEFNDVTAIGSRNNLIQGNFIGVNAAGTTGVANQGAGVLIFGGAPSNTIGGTAAGAGNVISGNLYQGISISSPGTNNTVVQGNIIGLNPAGTGKIQNTSDGIGIYSGAQATTIGGTTAAARNLISGNLFSGVSISGNGTNNNLVQGNYIGVDVTGAIAQGNGGDGVAISGDFPAPSPTPAPAPNTGAQSNTIGGTAVGARNVISGNGGSGVTIGNPGDTGTNNNLVQGNYIGVDLNGSNAIANAGSGVALYGGAQFNTVGGTLVAARNIIAGNNGSGVNIGGIGYTQGQTFGPRQNLILGNYIGVDATGAARGNGSVGVGVFGSAQSNTIGGTAPGARNVISGNTFREVDISGANTTGNTFLGNLLGLDPTGVSAIVSTNTSGIGFADGAHDNTIGGTSGGSRNFISGHQNYGIYFADFGTTGNSVQGNTIGLNINGTSVPNSFPGVAFFNSAQANTIGGSAIGASNIIAGNTNEGIAVYSFNTNPPTIKETFSLNSIFANGGKGIALYDGGNNSQPFPSLTSVALSTAINPNGTDVSGNFAGSASRIEFFASPTGDPSGFGEGQYFVGSISVGGAGPFTAHLSAVVPAGYAIAATATDTPGNTSEFSQTFIVPPPGDNGADGLPDEWMLNHFGHTAPQSGDQSRAGDDPDGDGLTNLQEFRAGTDPRSAASALRIVAMTRSGGDLNLTFASVPGKTYRLEAKDDLLSANCNLVADQVFASGISTQVIDSSAASLPRRFYRVVIEP